MKRVLPILAALTCGLLVLMDFFVTNPTIDEIGGILVEGVTILAAFALLLGLLNLIGVHGKRLVAHESKGGLSLILILALLATLVVGVALPASQEIAWIFDYVSQPLQSTMAALLAFFVVSAAYRAFRLRNVEAAILLVTSLFMLLAQLPFIQAWSPYMPILREWIVTIPVTAGMRGILLGISLGTIATSLRILLAVDRPYTRG
ncbi:MAG: hypothetical protein A2Y73_09080 [Chloroflexi bacterium RBG_13_56_8]|nr:MAG: hypothetical protein A2Y73_09080 [Chloroflexi bacterium RBG_13_56_8]